LKYLAIVLALLPLTPAAAQDVIGTSVIGGKRIEILSDNTWRYSDFDRKGDGPCVPIDNRLTFCGSILDWRPMNTTGTDFVRQFKHSERIYAGVIHENLGASDGVDNEYMRNIVIENVAMFTNVRPEEIPIFGVEPVEVDGTPAETIVYGAIFNGLDIVYQNTLINGDDFNLQFVVWSVGDQLSEDAVEMNANFLSSFRLTLEN
jgi:hypothetical protein